MTEARQRVPRSTVLLVTVGLVVLGVFMASRGGPVLARFPLLAYAPLALAGVIALTVSALYPPAALVVATLAVFYANDSKELGGALACVLLGMTFAGVRARGVPRASASLVVLFGVLAVLMSYAAPLLPAPSARRSIVYAIVVCIGALVIRPPRVLVVWLLGLLGVAFCFEALSHSALRTDRGDAVVLGFNANGVGFMCAIAFVFGASLLKRHARVQSAAAVAICLLAVDGMVQAGSRGAVLAAVAGGLVVPLRHRIVRVGPKSAAALLGLGVLVLVVSGPAMNWIAEAAGRDLTNNDNIVSRASALRFAFQATAQHPVTGVGLSDLDTYSLFDVNSSYNLSAHNAFVARFAESGVLVGTVFVALLVIAFVKAWRYQSAKLLPFIVLVYAAGISLDWFDDARASVVVLLLIGTALGFRGTQGSAASDPAPVEASTAASELAA